MLDIKQWIKKVTDWLNTVGYGEPTDYSSALYNATLNAPWTAPKSGMMVITAGTNGGARAYWYIVDATIGINMAHATRLETANYMLGASFPVIKGHKYYSQKANISSVYGHLYPIVGGVINNLLKALPSLAYRGGGASVERKALISQNAYPIRRLLGCGGTNTKLFVQKPAVWWFSIRCIKDWVYTFGCCGLHLFSSRLVLLKCRLTGNSSKYIYIQKFKYNSVSKFNIEGIIPQRLTASVKGVAVC